jgi:4-hydroxyphenylpyruvate dioxygenase
MSTTFFESAVDRKHGLNPLGLKGIDHIEFIVDNADQWRDFFVGKYGMSCRYYADAHSGVPGRRAHVVGQGRINFLVAEPAGQGPEADFLRWHLDRHGCGVRDVAFRVKDARFALTEAARRGAKVIRPLDEHAEFNGGSIAAYGDTIHTFIERKPHTDFAPGYRPVAGGVEEGDIHFAMIDHVVANVEHMDEWVNYYSNIFGFDLFMHFDINTGRSALMSKVMSSTDGWVKMPINEPSSQNSQIQEFLERRRDRRGQGTAAQAQDPRRPGPRRLPAAALHQMRLLPPDALLRGDPAPRRCEGLRRGQFPRPLRGDRTRTGQTRHALSYPRAPRSHPRSSHAALPETRPHSP